MGVVLVLSGCALLVPAFDVVVCESHEYDSSYGDGRFELLPPSVSCDFSRDQHFPVAEPERRFTGLLTASSVLAGVAGAVLATLLSRAAARERANDGDGDQPRRWMQRHRI